MSAISVIARTINVIQNGNPAISTTPSPKRHVIAEIQGLRYAGTTASRASAAGRRDEIGRLPENLGPAARRERCVLAGGGVILSEATGS